MTIRDQIKSFHSFMREHSNFGAVDTEPRSTLYSLLEKSFAGEDFPEEFDPEEWQLYSSIEGSDEVANELTAKYRDLHYAIQEAPHKEIVDAANYYGIEY